MGIGMSQPWLIFDVHYLCHRAFHTMSSLSWEDKPTGVIFGFLKQIGALKEEFQTDNVAFCFEHHYNGRKSIFPEYKQRRHQKQLTESEFIAKLALKEQIHKLYTDYLLRIGFCNVFMIPGLESDDIMAVLARDTQEETILVTADTDLLQCLRPNVTVYSPQKQKLYTEEWFWKTYKIPPRKWALVKAIAGCHTDEVPGIKGIGEATALKFVRNELDPNSAAYKKIKCKEGKAIVRRNKELVKLPLPSWQSPVAPALGPDHIDVKEWKAVCKELGMHSIAGQPPIATQRMISSKYATRRKRI
jgi:5'-3' exonuclease